MLRTPMLRYNLAHCIFFISHISLHFCILFCILSWQLHNKYYNCRDDSMQVSSQQIISHIFFNFENFLNNSHIHFKIYSILCMMYNVHTCTTYSTYWKWIYVDRKIDDSSWICWSAGDENVQIVDIADASSICTHHQFLYPLKHELLCERWNYVSVWQIYFSISVVKHTRESNTMYQFHDMCDVMDYWLFDPIILCCHETKGHHQQQFESKKGFQSRLPAVTQKFDMLT